jgi:hypothetical protein
MYRSTQRRSGSGRRNVPLIAAITVLVLGAGGIVAMTNVSSAEEGAGDSGTQCGPAVPGAVAPDGQDVTSTQQNGRTVRNYWGDGQETADGCAPAREQVVSCPTVGDKLPEVPAELQAQVDQALAQLQAQVTEANRRLAAAGGWAGQRFLDSRILAPLKSQREQLLGQIAQAVGSEVISAEELLALAPCKVIARTSDDGGTSPSADPSADPSGDPSADPSADPSGDPSAEPSADPGNGDNGDNDNPLGILADNCGDGSELEGHDGFQNGNRCVDTEMGEVGDAAKNPSLLITRFPRQVEANEPFTIRVSTRNLIRDRFLAAGKGGYYVEMSLLNEQGLVRGHFHTACRMLNSTREAPDPEPVPAFFVATEDGGGGDQPDEIVIQVPGLPEAGIAQCASWAGDGSHRLPMMQRANQTPAFDAVRISVR